VNKVLTAWWLNHVAAGAALLLAVCVFALPLIFPTEFVVQVLTWSSGLGTLAFAGNCWREGERQRLTMKFQNSLMRVYQQTLLQQKNEALRQDDVGEKRDDS